MTNQSSVTPSRVDQPGRGPLDTSAVTQTVYGSPAVLALSQVPRPIPDAGEVLVEVHAASVNARDWHIMRGEPRLARLLDPTIFGRRGPRVPTRGTDLAGVVQAVGAGVDHWKAGDKVFGEGIGTFASHVGGTRRSACRHSRRHRLRGRGRGTARRNHCVTVHQRRRPDAGQPASSINGASGGVGTFAIQLAKARGLDVTAVVSTRNLAPGRGSRRGPV